MDKEQLKKTLEKANELQKGKEVALAKEFIDLNTKVDTVAEKADKLAKEVDTQLTELIGEIKKKDFTAEELKGDKGDPGRDGKDGKDYVLNENDKKEIASKISVPVVEKVVEKTEVIKEQPIINTEIVEVAKYETPDQITDKVNLGKPLIKKERVEGLTDIERIAKIGAEKIYTGVSETRVRELISLTPAGSSVSFGTTTQIPYMNTGGTDFLYSANHTFDGSLETVTANSLGATTDSTKGMYLRNTTSAAAGAQQVSPPLTWEGQGWKTLAGGGTHQVQFRAYLLPVQGVSLPSGVWTLQSQINNAGWTDRFTVNSAGTVGANIFSATSSVVTPLITTSSGDLTIASTSNIIQFSSLAQFSWNSANVTLTHSSGALTLAGYFGIGTTPTAQLDIYNAGNYPTLRLKATTNYPYIMQVLKPNGTNLWRNQWDGGNFHHYMGAPIYYNMAGNSWTFDGGGSTSIVNLTNGAKFYLDATSASSGLVQIGGFSYATAINTLTAIAPMNVTTWAWNGSNGYTLYSQFQLNQTQLSTTSGDARMDFKENVTGNVFMSMLFYNKRIGINTTAPDRSFEINDASGNCLRLTYNDSNGSAANYVDFLVSSSGDLTITPSGGDVSIGTGNVFTTGSIELGHATDTTLSRSSAGVLAVEGVVIPSISSTNTLTNKRVTPRVTSETSSATPTINTDNSDAHSITALATAVTSMTTNLSGTPTNFQKLIIRFKDDGTARAITWGTGFEAKGVALPTTTVISKVLTVGFIYDTVTSKWGCVASAQEA